MRSDTEMPETVEGGEKVKALGSAFIIAFVRLLQMVRIHEAGNRLTVNAAQQFLDAGKQLIGEYDDAISLEARHGRLFLQGRRVLLQKQNAVFIFTLLTHMEEMGLYGLKFNIEFADATTTQVYRFATAMIAAAKAEAPIQDLEKRFAEPELDWVEVLVTPQKRKDLDPFEREDIAYRIYSYAYNSVKEISQKILRHQPTGVRKTLRVVQDITDLIYIDKSILLGACTIRDFDDYTFTHSVNVSIQSICLGHQIGLSRNSLVRLGICGLFHDLGKVDIPIEIINKAGPLDALEHKEIRQHSLNSVRRILKLEAHSDLVTKIILPPFEHHLKYDLSGYPTVNWSRPLSLFGRIIQICDVYDALTSPRVYRPMPYSPDRALGFMLNRAGKEFDPLLLKWFINMHGILPVGTLVKLDTGEFGLVQQGGEVRKNRLPQIILLKKKADTYEKGEVVDLNRKAANAGDAFRMIKSTHHPSELGIQPALYLM